MVLDDYSSSSPPTPSGTYLNPSQPRKHSRLLQRIPRSQIFRHGHGQSSEDQSSFGGSENMHSANKAAGQIKQVCVREATVDFERYKIL